jgi:Cu+-exporting ATPase
MVDPVCGMSVEPPTAAAAWEHAGQAYLFCSLSCFERFREDPDRYLAIDPDERGM